MSLPLIVRLFRLFRWPHKSSSEKTADPRQETGDLGEKAALKHLEFEGYRIRALNYTVHNVGEIDIVAEENRVICFVEVRTITGSENADPFATVNHDKKRHLTKAAMHYLRKCGLENRDWRFDFVSVIIPGDKIPRVELIRDAFPPER